MSDCGVCVGFDGEVAQVFNQVDRTSRKLYKCCECSKEIPIGSKYQLCTMLVDGDWSTWRTCAVCAEIRKAFSCEGECVGGIFWEGMDYCFEALTTGCLNRLQTPEAKKELLRRWNEWKFGRV